MMKNIDLQCHTTASDGKLSPRKLVELAIKKNLSAIAITDHDSFNGIDEAIIAAKGKNIEIVPGVEISCDDKGYVDTHILGLFINHKNKTLKSLIKKARTCRERQKKEIITKFRKLGFKITFDEVKAIAKGEIGRPHIAKIIIKNNPDKVNSFDEAFDKYLSVGKLAYVERRNKISIKEAIKAVHAANGLVFISHPGVYNNFNIDKFIDYFLKNGGDGIETYYSYETSRYHTGKRANAKTISEFRKIVKEKNILETGGSDFHGRPDQVLGKLKIPYSVLKNLRNHINLKRYL
ncbi:MAG TPA: PHP domain-containing protein [Candidatus Nanoarchaeia archaeon]|nr:PHP domain-containing protein [Candidatus Nanoarchaeia archaeon]